MKAKAKAASKAAAEVLLTVTISASLKAQVSEMASADKAFASAKTKSEKTIVNTGEKVAKEFASTAAKEGRDKTREAVRTALLPIFTSLYKDDEDYGKQQLSRVLSIAFPGGAKADDKSIARGTEQLAKGKAAGFSANDLVRLANGNAVIDKEGDIVSVSSAGSGGHNAKKPREAAEDSITEAIVALKVLKGFDYEMLQNIVHDVAVTMEVKGAKDAE